MTLTFNSSLTELQLMIVMAHEYTHLELLEKSRTAGSSNEFALKEPELLSAINNSSEPTDWGKINDGHHEYMGSHVERWKNVYEVLSPVQSEDFYKYGKWGGGATSSDAFLKLTKSERDKIIEYLTNNNL